MNIDHTNNADKSLIDHFLPFFLLKSTDTSELISLKTDSLILIDETSLFITSDLLDALEKLSLLSFITLAFSPFFLFTKLESPDFALDRSNISLSLSEIELIPRMFTLGAPLMFLLIYRSTSLS